MNKSIEKRMSKLEMIFPVPKFDTKEVIENVIEEIEMILQYEVKDRIKLSKSKYFDKDVLVREIFSCLTKEELRIIAYLK